MFLNLRVLDPYFQFDASCQRQEGTFLLGHKQVP